MWQWTYPFLLLAKSWLEVAPASAPYDGPLAMTWAGLYQAPTGTITANSVMSGITECNYDGYARQEVVWFPPFINSVGAVQDKGAILRFAAIDSTVPNMATGVFLASASSGGILYGGQVLPPPGVSLMSAGQSLFVTPAWFLSALLVYGAWEFNF